MNNNLEIKTAIYSNMIGNIAPSFSSQAAIRALESINFIDTHIQLLDQSSECFIKWS